MDNKGTTHLAGTFANPLQRAYVILVGARIFVTVKTAFQAQDVHAEPSEHLRCRSTDFGFAPTGDDATLTAVNMIFAR